MTVLVPFLFFIPIALPALVVLGLWFVLQLGQVRVAAMVGGGVAYLAHVAGFLTGAILTLSRHSARQRLRGAPGRRLPPTGRR